jgi:YbbR domain-containing protein
VRSSLWTNLGSALLALVLALIIWFVARYEQNPFVNREISGVPIALLNQPADTVLFEPIERQVTLTVRAPEELVPEAQPDMFFVSMDLEGIEPGSATSVPLIAISEDDRFRVESVVPAQETVRLERVRDVTATVNLSIDGEPSVGYEAGPLTISPTTVLVRGPEPLVGQLDRLEGSISLTDARQSVSEDVSLQAMDAEGNPISGLTILPPTTHAEIPIRQKLGFKPGVAVRVDLRGRPAEGYRIDTVEVAPDTVTLAGAPVILAGLDDFVSTRPITITGATVSLVQRTTLTLPQGVALVETQFVTVSVEIVPLEGSRTISVPVTYQGLQPGLAAAIAPEVVDLVLSGPQPLLNQLRPADVTVVLNLLEVDTPGTYRLQPTVLLPEGLSLTSINPGVVVVRVERMPTPTRAAVLTPTATVSP